MHKLLQIFIVCIALAGITTASSLTPTAQAEGPCSLRGTKVGHNLYFYISSPNFTGDSGTDLPRITVGNYVSFNEFGDNLAPTNYNWNDVEKDWNPYNQSWSFVLKPDMPGYDAILTAATTSSDGVVLDGRTGNNYCSDDDDYSYTINTGQTLPTQCYTTTADIYTSPACQKERQEYEAANAAYVCNNLTGNLKINCMKQEFCLKSGSDSNCITNLSNDVLNAIHQAAGTLPTKIPTSQTATNNLGSDAQESIQNELWISQVCASYPEHSSTCRTLAKKCLENENKERCLDKEICQSSKGSVYATLFRNTQGGACFTLAQFIPTLLNYFMMFAAIIAGFLFVWAGYKYLTSKGDPSALADAKDMIMQVVIGLVILSLAFVIIQVLGAAFSGVDSSILLI